jgi:hypothetical protein
MILKGFIQCAATEDCEMRLGEQGKKRSLQRQVKQQMAGSKQKMVVFQSVLDICGGILGNAGK